MYRKEGYYNGKKSALRKHLCLWDQLMGIGLACTLSTFMIVLGPRTVHYRNLGQLQCTTHFVEINCHALFEVPSARFCVLICTS